jgi:WD40 repeat protein
MSSLIRYVGYLLAVSTMLSLIAWSEDRTLLLWDLEESGPAQIKSHVWSLSRQDAGPTVYLGEILRTLEGHTDSIWAVAVAPDGRRSPYPILHPFIPDRKLRYFGPDSGTHAEEIKIESKTD